MSIDINRLHAQFAQEAEEALSDLGMADEVPNREQKEPLAMALAEAQRRGRSYRPPATDEAIAKTIATAVGATWSEADHDKVIAILSDWRDDLGDFYRYL